MVQVFKSIPLLDLSAHVREAYKDVFGREPKIVLHEDCIVIDTRYRFGFTRSGYFTDQIGNRFTMIHNDRNFEVCIEKLLFRIYWERVNVAMHNLKAKETANKLQRLEEPWTFLQIK